MVPLHRLNVGKVQFLAPRCHYGSKWSHILPELRKVQFVAPILKSGSKRSPILLEWIEVLSLSPLLKYGSKWSPILPDWRKVHVLTRFWSISAPSCRVISAISAPTFEVWQQMQFLHPVNGTQLSLIQAAWGKVCFLVLFCHWGTNWSIDQSVLFVTIFVIGAANLPQYFETCVSLYGPLPFTAPL